MRAPRNEALEAWIEREFAGYGLAMRRKEDPPIPGEPLMSMAEAKELTRRAVAEFSRLPQIAAKAREWAAHYPEASDGRNTFILFAEWVEKEFSGGHK